MSRTKTHAAMFAIFLCVSAGLTIVKNWQDGNIKAGPGVLPLVRLDPINIKPKTKLMQSQQIIGSEILAKEKHLQLKLDNALTDIARLQREKMVLIGKLDNNSTTNNRVQRVKDIINAENEPLSKSKEPIQISEQLENRFNQENQDLHWAVSVEEAITSQYFDSVVNGNELVDARCQSTLCRVEMSHSDQAAEALFWTNASAVKGLSADQRMLNALKARQKA